MSVSFVQIYEKKTTSKLSYATKPHFYLKLHILYLFKHAASTFSKYYPYNKKATSPIFSKKIKNSLQRRLFTIFFLILHTDKNHNTL